MTPAPSHPDGHGAGVPPTDWIEALLATERVDDTPPPLADDGFSERVLLQIGRLQAERAAPAAAALSPGAVATALRQQAGVRRQRWTWGGSVAGAVVTGGALAVAGWAAVGATPWLVTVALTTALIAWALLQERAA